MVGPKRIHDSRDCCPQLSSSLYSTMAYSPNPIPTPNENPNAISEKEEEISKICLSTIRVLTKGFAVGGSLYTGLELLSAVSSKRIFKRYIISFLLHSI